MKAFSIVFHFDITRSKCRQTKSIVMQALLILMSRHADSTLPHFYLTDLWYVHFRCKFATSERGKGVFKMFRRQCCKEKCTNVQIHKSLDDKYGIVHNRLWPTKSLQHALSGTRCCINALSVDSCISTPVHRTTSFVSSRRSWRCLSKGLPVPSLSDD